MKKQFAGFLFVPVAALLLFFAFLSQMFAQESALPYSAQTTTRVTRMSVFSAPVDYTLSTTVAALAQGDFNDDEKPDLAVGSSVFPCDSGEGAVTIYLGNGDGTFPTSGSSSFNSGGPCPLTVLAADLNSDGKLDLAVANLSNSGTNAAVNIFLGNGDGTFTAAGSYDSGSTGIAALGDFNGDGIMDIAVSDSTGMGVDILLGNGNGTFRLAGSSIPLPDYVGSIYVTDLNSDGKQDLVVASEGQGGYFYVLLGKGDGTFQRPTIHSIPSGFTSIVVADFNNDGKPDIGFAEDELFCDGASKGYVGVRFGNGDGTFQPSLLTNTTDRCGYNGAAAGDFNVDGRIDLLAEGAVSNPIGSRLFLGHGDGSFQLPENLSCLSGSGSAGTVVSDLNGDGAPDLVLALRVGNGFCVQLNESGVVASLTSSLNPSELGQDVTFTTTVSPTFPLRGTPTGTIKFSDGMENLGTVALTSGVASFTTSFLAVGRHKIRASYSGDSIFVPVRSPAIIQIVKP
jgi:hypothetical protein